VQSQNRHPPMLSGRRLRDLRPGIARPKILEFLNLSGDHPC
jgi:hypothetical protein